LTVILPRNFSLEINLKHLIGLAIIALSALFLISGSTSTQNLTQATISIPNFNSCDLQTKLEKEFCSINSVSLCQSNLLTNTLTLQYDDRKLSKIDIEGILAKWGCYSENISFHKLIP